MAPATVSMSRGVFLLVQLGSASGGLSRVTGCGGMERGFLSQKGSRGGRDTLVVVASTVKEGVTPSVVDMIVEKEKISSLEDITGIFSNINYAGYYYGWPPMLERGSYIPWASRFKRFLNRKRENRKWLLKALEDGPYVFRNITPTGSTLPRLQEVEDLQGDDLLYYDAKMELTRD
ncbi:hypothetical protein Tco_0483717 [Tanacetum coccineum]